MVWWGTKVTKLGEPAVSGVYERQELNVPDCLAEIGAGAFQ